MKAVQSYKDYQKTVKQCANILPKKELWQSLESFVELEVAIRQLVLTTHELSDDNKKILQHIALTVDRQFRNLLTEQQSILLFKEIRIVKREAVQKLHMFADRVGSKDLWGHVFGKNKEFRQIFTKTALEHLQDLELLKLKYRKVGKNMMWSHIFLTQKGWLAALLITGDDQHCKELRSLSENMFLKIETLTNDSFQQNLGLVLGRNTELLRYKFAQYVKLNAAGVLKIYGDSGAGKNTTMQLLRHSIMMQPLPEIGKQIIWVDIQWYEHLSHPNPVVSVIDALISRSGFTCTSISELIQELRAANQKLLVNFIDFDAALADLLIRDEGTPVLQLFDEVILRLNHIEQSPITIFMNLTNGNTLGKILNTTLKSSPPLLAELLSISSVKINSIREFLIEAILRIILHRLANVSFLDTMLLDLQKITDALVSTIPKRWIRESLEQKSVTTLQLIHGLSKFLTQLQAVFSENITVNNLLLQITEDGETYWNNICSYSEEFLQLQKHAPLYSLAKKLRYSETQKHNWIPRNEIETVLGVEYSDDLQLPLFRKLFRVTEQGIGFKHSQILHEFSLWEKQENVTEQNLKILVDLEKIDTLFLLAAETRQFYGFPDELLQKYANMQPKILQMYAQQKNRNTKLLPINKIAQILTLLLLDNYDISPELLKIEQIDFSDHLLKIHETVVQNTTSQNITTQFMQKYATALMQNAKRYRELQNTSSAILVYIAYLPASHFFDAFYYLLSNKWKIANTETYTENFCRNYIQRLAGLPSIEEEKHRNQLFMLGRKITAQEDNESTRILWYRLVLALLQNAEDIESTRDVLSYLLFESKTVKTTCIKFLQILKIKNKQLTQLIKNQDVLIGEEIDRQWITQYSKWLIDIISAITLTIDTFDNSKKLLINLITEKYEIESVDAVLGSLDFNYQIRQRIISASQPDVELKSTLTTYALSWYFALKFPATELPNEWQHNFRNKFVEIFILDFNAPLIRSSQYEQIALQVFRSQLNDMDFLAQVQWIKDMLTQLQRSSNLSLAKLCMHHFIKRLRDGTRSPTVLQHVTLLTEWGETIDPADSLEICVLALHLVNLQSDLLTNLELEREITATLQHQRQGKALLIHLSQFLKIIAPLLTDTLLSLIQEISNNTFKFDFYWFISLLHSTPEQIRKQVQTIPLSRFRDIASFMIALHKGQIEQLFTMEPPILPPRYAGLLIRELCLTKNGFISVVSVADLNVWIKFLDTVANNQTGIPGYAIAISLATLDTYLEILNMKDKSKSLVNATILLNYTIDNWNDHALSRILKSFEQEGTHFSSISTFYYLIHHYQEKITKTINSVKHPEDLLQLVQFICKHDRYQIEIYASAIQQIYQRMPHNTDVETCYKLMLMHNIELM